MDIYLRKQLKAIDLAVKALTERRRKLYAAGESAFQKGIDFTFALDGHRHYDEHTQAIRELEDLKEILTDPGVTVEPEYQQESML
jgi:hypothetical protein